MHRSLSNRFFNKMIILLLNATIMQRMQYALHELSKRGKFSECLMFMWDPVTPTKVHEQPQEGVKYRVWSQERSTVQDMVQGEELISGNGPRRGVQSRIWSQERNKVQDMLPGEELISEYGPRIGVKYRMQSQKRS